MAYNDIHIPLTNPVRLLVSNITYTSRGIELYNGSDWENTYPNIDNMKLKTQYFKGVEPSDFMPDWRVGENIKVQLRGESYAYFDSYKLYRVTDSGDVFVKNMTKTNITPAGWVGFDVVMLSCDIDSDGYYILKINYNDVVGEVLTEIVSDVFYATNTLPVDKNLIKVQYKNSYNNLGMIWNDYYTLFISGILTPQPSISDKSILENSAGIELLRTSNKNRMLLSITDQSNLYLPDYSNIFGCDDILINGISYNSLESLDISSTSNSDIVDINIMLSTPNNNYLRNIL